MRSKNLGECRKAQTFYAVLGEGVLIYFISIQIILARPLLCLVVLQMKIKQAVKFLTTIFLF
ncbi:MAG: hypothetical protein CO106_00210 [Deltaproteobacteria bacterium CG_4_9_14_3_um_filter_44_9]|nr:MAG: hypothetical protein CO106_00210 [Deltaproteobacteria bacterium CG_4_9_14_3_um_filter_44_9]